VTRSTRVIGDTPLCGLVVFRHGACSRRGFSRHDDLPSLSARWAAIRAIARGALRADRHQGHGDGRRAAAARPTP